MARKIVPACSSILLLVACNMEPTPDGTQSTPLVNLQVTETSDPQAFDRILSEVRARQIKSTILIDADFATQNCQTLKTLDSEGFEIMAFARPEAQDDQIVTMSMLSYEDQDQLITGVKTAIEDCLGKSVTGFRCYRFDQNKDTYAILDSLGFQFNLGFVAQTGSCLPGHEDDTLPYQAPEYSFWAVPMYSAQFEGQRLAFCDMPFQRVLDADGWSQLLKDEFDKTRAEGRPLIVEIHPYYSGVDEGRFNAFVSFLDYAVQQNAQFITVAELVQWSQQQPTTRSALPCDQQ